MEQQIQAFNYFSESAHDWQRKALQSTFNVINNRHYAVLETIKKHKKPSTFLDIGCGTGQLAIEVSKMGLESLGIDFAPEMINQCNANNKQACANAEFICDSIFNVQLPQNHFDVISAQGFIEYISLDELEEFLAQIASSLKIGGALALGSRNRLFNLHSLNAYTTIEVKLNNIENLIKEAIIIQESADQETIFHQLCALNIEYQHPNKHPETGIKVETRYQFTPGDLASRLKRHGLKPTRIFPVHYHGFPLTALKLHDIKGLHNELATVVSTTYINHHTFVPYSSSFVIEAIKE